MIITTSCHENRTLTAEVDGETPDYGHELSEAIAECRRCLASAAEIPHLDLLETVARDRFVLNNLKASGTNRSAADAARIRSAE